MALPPYASGLKSLIVDAVTAETEGALTDLVTDATTQADRASLKAFLGNEQFADETELEAYTNALLEVGDSTITRDGGVYVLTDLDPLTWVREDDSDGKKAGDAADAAADSAGAAATSAGEAVTTTQTIMGVVDALEYDRSGYVTAIFDEDYRVLEGSTYTPGAAAPVIATGLDAGGTSIAILDPLEYSRSGFGEALFDNDFRLLSPSVADPPASDEPADTLYDLIELSDGTNTMVHSVSRASGAMVKLSPAASDHTALSIRSDGFAVYKSSRASGPPGNLFARDVTGVGAEMPVVPYRKIVAYGDSLTYVSGITANTYWKKLGDLLGWPSVGFGVNGQTARQVAARMGARPVYVTLTSNQIPASGAVALTAISETPITGGLPNLLIAGTLAGIAGILSWDGTTYSFTRSASGSIVAVPAGTQFYPTGAGVGSTTPYQRDGLLIAWAARNSYFETASIIENLRLIINDQRTLTKRFIVPLCLYGEGDETGTANRAVIDYSNAAIKAAWPDNWIDFNPALQAAGNGSTEDNADIASGITPRSLRIKDGDGVTVDFLHPNAAGNTVLANALQTLIIAKGWNL